MGVRFLEEGRENLPCLLYADDLVLCGESEEQWAIAGRFVEVCKRRDLKVNPTKSKVIC